MHNDFKLHFYLHKYHLILYIANKLDNKLVDELFHIVYVIKPNSD